METSQIAFALRNSTSTRLQSAAVKAATDGLELGEDDKHRIAPLTGVQIALAVAKLIHVHPSVCRQAALTFLPRVVTKLSATEWVTTLEAVAKGFNINAARQQTLSALRIAEAWLVLSWPHIKDSAEATATWQDLFVAVVFHLAVHDRQSRTRQFPFTYPVQRLKKFLKKTPDAAKGTWTHIADRSGARVLPAAIVLHLVGAVPAVPADMVVGALDSTSTLNPTIFRALGIYAQIEATPAVVSASVKAMQHPKSTALDVIAAMAIFKAIPGPVAQKEIVDTPGVATALVSPLISEIANVSAKDLAESLEGALALASDDVWAAVIRAAFVLLRSSAKSSVEKCRLMDFLFYVLPTHGKGVEAEADTFAAQVQMLVNSSAMDIRFSAWRCCSYTFLAAATLSKIESGIRGALSNEDERRVCLTALPPTFDLKAMTTELLADCANAPAYLPDALLSLRFDCAAYKQEALQVLFVAEVVNQFKSEQDLDHLFTISASLAKKGATYTGLALLLTHPNGAIRRRAKEFLQANMSDKALVQGLWAACETTIFDLDGTGKGTILSRSAAGLLLTVGNAVLSHATEAELPTVLGRVVLACGHPYVAGIDKQFFAPRLGSGIRRAKLYNPHVFDALFHWRGETMEKDQTAVATFLASKLTVPHPVIAMSAGRGLALLMSTALHEDNVILESVKPKVLESFSYFKNLDPIDVMILSNDPDQVAAYVDKEVHKMGLVKTYTAKPPKGMDEEDYSRQKKKDQLALKAGRESVFEGVQKRREALAADQATFIGPIATLRCIGESGHRCKKGPLLAGFPHVLPSLLANVGCTLPKAVQAVLFEAVDKLLNQTVLEGLGWQLADITAKLSNKDTLNTATCNYAAAFALRLRLIPGLVEAPAFSVIMPFARSVLAPQNPKKKTGVMPQQAQHQTLMVLVSNCVQPTVVGKDQIVDILINVLYDHHAFYKMAAAALLSVTPNLSMNETRPLFDGLMIPDAPSLRDATMKALAKYPSFEDDRVMSLLAMSQIHDEEENVRSTALALAAAKDLTPAASDIGVLVPWLKDYFDVSPITKIGLQLRNTLVDHPDVADAAVEQIIAVGGYSAIVALNICVSQMTLAGLRRTMTFLCDTAEQEQDEDTMEVVLTCGKTVLDTCTMDQLKALAPEVQPRLHKPPPGVSSQHKDLHFSVAIVWLTVIASRSNDVEFLNSVMDKQAVVLNSSASQMVHLTTCNCIADVAKHPLVRNGDKVIEFGTKCINQTLNSPSYVKKKANAYGSAGVLKGLGLIGMRKLNVLNAITNGVTTGKQAQKSGAMVLIEILAEVLHANFEPYSLTLVPQLLDCLAERDNNVTQCADDAAKSVMKRLSDVGLRQLVPRLVDGLKSEQTKKKASSLSLIGFVAFCSPRQLAAALPSIVPYVCTALFDANERVATFAFNSLKRVAGVVSNTEIQEHTESILSALRNPATDTEAALDALLYTRFSNVVDPASLALIVPILCRGLADRSATAKSKAAQIVAAMVQLVNNTQSLAPYAEELLEKLRTATSDPLVDVRTTSSKAISAMCCALGPDYVNNTVAWCFHTLAKGSSISERSGAGQVFGDVAGAVGEPLVRQMLPEIVAGVDHENAFVREGFMYMFVYAPSTMGQQLFQTMLSTFFPMVLRRLSDSNDRVRDVALQAGSNIISMFGARNLSLVLQPLLTGAVSETTPLRHASALLTCKLLTFFVTQLRRKSRAGIASAADADGGEEEEEEDESVVAAETARDAEKKGLSVVKELESELGPDVFNTIFAALHVAKSEPNHSVRTEVNISWSICIANTRSITKRVFPEIIALILKFFSSENEDCVQLAKKCVTDTCARMTEGVDEFIMNLAKEYPKANTARRIGVLLTLAEVTPHSDHQSLSKLGPSIVPCVLAGLKDDNDKVREYAATVFEGIGRIVGPQWIEDMVEKQMSMSVVGVIELVKVRPKAAIKVVFRMLMAKMKLSTGDMEMILLLLEVPQAVQVLDHHHDAIITLLLQAEREHVPNAGEATSAFASCVDASSVSMLIADMQREMKSPETRAATLRSVASFGEGLDTEAFRGQESLLRIALQSLADSDPEVAEQAVTTLISLSNSFDRSAAAELNENDRNDPTTSKRHAGKYSLTFLDSIQSTISVTARSSMTDDCREIPALGLPKAFDTILLFYTRALDYGASSQKTQAVEGIQELLEFAPMKTVVASLVAIIGKCVKALYDRNDGSVVAALLQLCLQLCNYKSPNQKMVEQTMVSALYGAMMCDSPQARGLALRLAITLLGRETKHGDMLLNAVASKKNTAETPVQKCSMAHYISVVMRHGKIEKKVMHAPTLLAIMRPAWEGGESMAMCAAAGSAIGALCTSIAIADNEVNAIMTSTLAMLQKTNALVVSGLAAAYSLIISCPTRLTDTFLQAVGKHVSAAVHAATDRTLTYWSMRVFAVLLGTPVGPKVVDPKSVTTAFSRVEPFDDQLMGASQFLVDAIKAHAPAMKSLTNGVKMGASSATADCGCYDADLEDELNSELR